MRTREDDPSRYWLGVGLLGFWGTLFAVVARLEYGSYRREPDVPEAVEPAPRSAPALTEWWQQWRELRQQRRELRREQDERSRQDRAARALDPVVRSAMDGVVRSLGARLKIAGIGWLEIVGPAPPHPRSLYVVFPAPSDLERFGVKTSKLEDSVREALCQQGYPDASLAHVSVHRTSTEVVSQSFGSDVVGQIRRP